MAPSLFIDAQGSTLISKTIYAVVIIVFLVGSFLFVRLYLQSKSSTSVLVLLCTVTLGNRHIWGDVAASIQRYSSVDRAVGVKCSKSVLFDCLAKCSKRNQLAINSISLS